jgi:hypothetical protein
MRAKKFIVIIVCLTARLLKNPRLGRKGSVCKAKRARQTKRCDFKGLRDELCLPVCVKRAQIYLNSLNHNRLGGKWTLTAPTHLKAQ